ncbi:MAG: methyltransferase [Thermoprotei archaeon]|nr:MAG: methyltransferase [Thermoprotei archaeon]
MYTYTFKPVKGYWFTKYLLEKLKEARGCIEITLDIGISTKRVLVERGVLLIDDYSIKINDVMPSSYDRVVLYEPSGRVYEVVRACPKGFYKLKVVEAKTAPTLEISGIHMHRITGITPWKDSELKVRKLKISPGDTVLDTCLGLGYTAIHSLIRGARNVYSVEIDENVLWIAERNPWSHRLVNNNIMIYRGDVTDIVKKFDTESFDKILHDPPRYTSSTGALYGIEFYRELYRVLKPGGRLYHYTGEPRKHSAPSIVKGIGERLRRAGFYPVLYDHRTLGYIAFKPRKSI